MGTANADKGKQASLSDHFTWQSPSVQWRSSEVSPQICHHGRDLGLSFPSRDPSSTTSSGSMSTRRCQSSFARLPLLAKSWCQYSGIVRVSWWLTTWSKREDCYWCLLCWTDQETLVSYQGKTMQKVELLLITTVHLPTPLPLPWPQFENVTSNCSVTCRITRSGSIWLPRVPIFERFTSFGCDEEVMHVINHWFELQDKKFFVDGVNSLAHRWEKCAWKTLYWKTVIWIRP